MSKVLKLKEWLGLDAAVDYITNALGEPVTKADLCRFALDGHLTISANFLDQVHAKEGRWVEAPEKGSWESLNKPITSISGVWDLTMAGAERLEIEFMYYFLTSGLKRSFVGSGGLFVQQDDVICQLQTDFEDRKDIKGSRAYIDGFRRTVDSEELKGTKIDRKSVEVKIKIIREEFLEERKKVPRDSHYYPSTCLELDTFVLVIRTKEIRRFIELLKTTPTKDKPLTTNERNSLLVLIGALCNHANIEPGKRGAAPPLVAMTEIIGAPLTDDTIRKILSQIEGAISTRLK